MAAADSRPQAVEMGNAGELTRALVDRVPGQSLIEKLLAEWDAGRIRVDEAGRVAVDDETRGWYWSVLGERRVAEVMSSLGREWTVLHSVPVGAGNTDIDHLAIGPSGVFTLNTKYTPGRKIWAAGRGLFVDGDRRPEYLRSSMSELARVESVLSRAAGFAVPVDAAIVFVGPAGITIKDAPGWDGTILHVVSDAELPTLLQRRREMSDEQLTKVLDAALRPETWHRAPRASQPGRNFAREFDALRDAVGPGLDWTGAAPIRTASRPRVRQARPAASRSRSAESIGQKVALGCLSAVAVPIAGWFVLNALLQHLLSR